MTDTSADLLAQARDLLARATPTTRGLWPRAAALLARQALESSLDSYWHSRGLPLGACSTKAQLLCLSEYSKDGDLAREAHHVWAALSRACHHHPYELAPTAGELEGWVEAVARIGESSLCPAAGLDGTSPPQAAKDPAIARIHPSRIDRS